MIKGVSQQVIEVQQTGHAYFEKAILFLRPSACSEDKSRLDAQATTYVNGIQYKRPIMRRAAGEILRVVAGILLGGLVTWLAMGGGWWV